MPRSKQPLLRLLAKHHKLDEWQRYEGPQGGKGWVNTVTGEKVYQEEKPGSDGSGGETKSAPYEKARSIIDENSKPGVADNTIIISRSAWREAVWKTNPEDAAEALIDTYEETFAQDGSDDARERAIRRSLRFVTDSGKQPYYDVKVNVPLADGDVVQFEQGWGDSIDFDGRTASGLKILKKEGFTDKEAAHFPRLMEKQKAGPKVAGSDRMEAFNVIATEDIGASGHTAKYRPFENEVEALRAIRGPMLKALRKMHGDTITLYRGEEDFEAGGNYGEFAGGTGYVNFRSHQPAESWSMRPVIAANFGEFILKKEVPIEQVVAANIIGAGYDREAEMLVAMDREQYWEYGDSLFYYDDIDEDGGAEDFDDNEKITTRELIVAELRAQKFQMMLTQPGMNLAQWVRYTGPRGGEGWQNVETGEVTYGEKPGDVDESQEQQTLPGAQIDTSQRYDEGDVWNDDIAITNIIRDVTGNEDLFDLDEFYEWVQQEGTEAHIAEVHSKLRAGPTPYDVSDDEVPDHSFNPNNYEEFGTLTEMLEGDMHGVSAENMFIAQNDRHDRIYITNLDVEVNSDANFARTGGKRANVASKLMRVMGEDTPEHHLVEGKYLAVKQSDGIDLRTHQTYSHGAADDQRSTLDNYAAHIAANIVVGNPDAHQRNVFYKYGEYETIDLDMAFGSPDPNILLETAGRKFNQHIETLYGYNPNQQEQAEIDEAVYFLSEELEYKAGVMQAWLTEDEKKMGISPDDLTDVQRERLEANIQLINSGEHWQILKDMMR